MNHVIKSFVTPCEDDFGVTCVTTDNKCVTRRGFSTEHEAHEYIKTLTKLINDSVIDGKVDYEKVMDNF